MFLFQNMLFSVFLNGDRGWHKKRHSTTPLSLCEGVTRRWESGERCYVAACNFIFKPRAHENNSKSKSNMMQQQRQLQQVNNNSIHTCHLPLGSRPGPEHLATWRLPGVKACCIHRSRSRFHSIFSTLGGNILRKCVTRHNKYTYVIYLGVNSILEIYYQV